MASSAAVTTGQVKAARALLGWSQGDLADASGVSHPSIKRLEADTGDLGGYAETQAKIGQGIATVHHHLNDPEKRAELERAAGTAGKTAARMLGRAAGNLRNKIGGD